MSPQDDSARDPVGLHEEWWAAESPFVGEAVAEEERAPIHPWYQGYTPFVERRELEEMYAQEAEWESDLAALEAEEVWEQLEGEPGDFSPQFEEQVPFTLPTGASPLPNDTALRAQLQAIGTAEARALDPAFARLGKRDVFAAALERAVRAMPEPTGTAFDRLRTHLVRLGVEAFILDVGIPTSWQSHIGFVDHPRRLHELHTNADQENYLHFAVRRLLAISFLPSTPDIDRRQMDRAAVLLRVFHAQLASKYRLIINSEAVLLAYRTLLVQIIWKHYQALLDRMLTAAAKSRLQWSVVDKKWEKDLETASSTREPDERALIPTFRLTPTLYRDYFNPAAATDIGYRHYTSTPPPVASPEMPFSAVFHRRVEQMAFIKYLRDERASDPLPRLHDSGSWQAWVRKTWDKPLLRREEKLAVILNYVSRYFAAFTVHAPHDLREGCSEKNYLTRVFPRAVTGSLVHDCVVYALRWLHILGGLLTPGSTPSGLAKPRIFLIEMPVHVGVMIRAKALFLRKPVEIVISINNKDAKVHEFDPVETDEYAARKVVQDAYSGMMTPFTIRRLSSKPSDATALWNEVCQILGRELTLPYKDPSEPHLRYLRHNAAIAHISREVSDAAKGLWLALQQKLEPAKGRSGKVPTARVIAEIRQYAASIEKMVKAASDKHAKDVKPLIAQINDDLRANQKRLAKGVLVVDTTPKLPWEAALRNYRPELERAIQSGDLSGIHPVMFFPEDDFAAAVD